MFDPTAMRSGEMSSSLALNDLERDRASVDLAGVTNPSLAKLENRTAGLGSALNADQANILIQAWAQAQSGESPLFDAALGEAALATTANAASETSAAMGDSLTGTTSSASGLMAQEDLGTLLGAHSYDDLIADRWWEVYSFTIDSASDLEMSLEDAHAGQSLWLFEADAAAGGASDFPEFVAATNGLSAEPWSLSLEDQAAGQYHAVILNAIAEDEYALNIEVNPLAGLTHHQGNLQANAFELESDSHFAVYSGEGNVEFGEASTLGLDALDHIDFGHFAIDDVTTWNPVTPNGGGQLYDPGDGLRLFDALELSDGRQILFEGIDRLQFADGHVDLFVEPNDEKFGEQWNLHMTGTHNAWRFTQGSPDVLIGVQDQGLEAPLGGWSPENGWSRPIHPELDKNRIQTTPWQLTSDIEKPSHGTGVHGIIAAESNNGVGMSGINWQSKIWHSDVFQPTIFQANLEQVIDATQLMTDVANEAEKPIVINMSFGWKDAPSNSFPQLEALIQKSQDKALFVVASGNEEDVTIVDYPANLAQKYENVVAVGASWGTEDFWGDEREPGTRIAYADGWGSNYGAGLSLMAPSEVITTEFVRAGLRSGRFEPAKFGYNEKFNGTSAAAPHVTGIASLVWSVNPELAASEVHHILTETAYDLSAFGTEFEYGSGLVDADTALRRSLALTHSPNSGLPSMSLRDYANSPEQSLMGIAVTAYEPDPVETEPTATEAVVATTGASAAIAAANSLPTLDWDALPELNFDALPELDWDALPELDFQPAQDFISLDFDALPTLDWDALPELNFQPVEGLEALTAIAPARSEILASLQRSFDLTPSDDGAISDNWAGLPDLTPEPDTLLGTDRLV